MPDKPGHLPGGGIGEVCQAALPLIVSSGTFAVKLFSDRLMLAWHSELAIGAALAAGMLAFMLESLCIGIASYANTFVSQYDGAGKPGRIGLAVWQSLFFSLAAGAVLISIGTLLASVFTRIGHPAELARLEEGYFRVIISGTPLVLVNSSLMCFWTGRNRTWTVVSVNAIAIVLNLILNWILIFGANGCQSMASYPWPLAQTGQALNQIANFAGGPAAGVVGAGVATISSDLFSLILFLGLFLTSANRQRFFTWPRRVFDAPLMARMIRYGFGNGMQLFMDIASFTVFNLLLGMYPIVKGEANVSAAAGIALSINTISFIPMLGVGIAASILVGRGIGASDIAYAERAVKNACYLILVYMCGMCLWFELYPASLVSLFIPGGEMGSATSAMAVDFLRFVGAYCLADGVFILYGHAIRGAGDTRFAMYAMAVTGWLFFALPCALAYYLGYGPYALWTIIVLAAILSALVFLWRYRQGKWKKMRVIEDPGLPIPE
ncbi:MAG: MATE family efflux transporter [Planctomycetota bacterium]|jgi:MATE family multidrug resistance protein|nr:MATE family efflux transporter [Planctomycetota bacterium]